MNMDLEKISPWTWKMSVNPDISKQAEKAIFSKKKNVNLLHLLLYFNRFPVIRYSYQKPLGVYLDKKIGFHQHITEKFVKTSKRIGAIKKLNNALPRKALLFTNHL